MKGLMGCCLSHEIVVNRLRAKAETKEAELGEL